MTAESTSGGQRTDEQAACRRRALDLLARREHSREELARKLLARSCDEAAVTATLAELEREGLLAEQRFVESFIRTRVGKGQGPVRIRAELVARGIDQAQAAELLERHDVDWVELAARTRAKRFGVARPDGMKERARQARFLQYRGFDSAQVMAALDLAGDLD